VADLPRQSPAVAMQRPSLPTPNEMAWFLPTLLNLFAGQSPRLPSLLMVLALLTLALSWHLLY
jgi:hypothetical protein